MSSSPQMPQPVTDVLRATKLSLLSTMTKKGTPIADGMAFIWEGGPRIDYGTGLSYPAKAERARNNPKVGLLFHTPREHREGVIVIHADASVEDHDLQATTDRWMKFSRGALGKDGREWLPGHYEDEFAKDGRSPYDSFFYWVRMFINCTPKRAFWWPDGPEQAPRIWVAPGDVVAPPSDPAPPGPPTKPTSPPPPPWQEVADKAIARSDLPSPYLTVVSDDGYPTPFPTAGVKRTDSGFRLAIAAGSPWTLPISGSGCLSFENYGLHIANAGGRFVGQVEQAGDDILFHVERALPVDLIMQMAGELDNHLFPPEHVREKRMARLYSELARRGVDMPLVRPPHEIP